jgi:hypothetical protein
VGEELTQTCRKCGKVKLLSEYYMYDYRRYVRCKACISTERRASYIRVTFDKRRRRRIAGEEKRCTGCGEVKPVHEFYLNREERPRPRCRVCMREQNTAAYYAQRALYPGRYRKVTRRPRNPLSENELVERRTLSLLLYDWERLAQIPGKTRRAKVLWLLDLADRQK